MNVLNQPIVLNWAISRLYVTIVKTKINVIEKNVITIVSMPRIDPGEIEWEPENIKGFLKKILKQSMK